MQDESIIKAKHKLAQKKKDMEIFRTMRKSSSTVKCQQFHLTLAQRRPKSCFERINVSKSGKTVKTPSNVDSTVKRCQSQQEICHSELVENELNFSSHDCIALKSNNGKVSQQILISSALRRPHASYYSQLDSQTLPDPAKPCRRPYQAKSASTVYSYAKRPVSASETSNHLGRHTKASLLRRKSAIEIPTVLNSETASSRDSAKKKKPCVVQQEYMLHKNLLSPKEVFDYMKSVHAYLTGARYNRYRLLDSKALSTLGVYIPKDSLNTFIMKKTTVAPKPEHDVSHAALKVIESHTSQIDVVGVATNTEPHYLSLNKWHGAEWSNTKGKKQIPASKQDSRRPVTPHRMKPIKTQYINYNNIVHVR